MPLFSHGLGRAGQASGPDLMIFWFERGKKNGCLAWPGLAEAGLSGENKMDSPKAGTRFFSPLRDIFCFPGGKMGSYARALARGRRGAGGAGLRLPPLRFGVFCYALVCFGVLGCA